MGDEFTVKCVRPLEGHDENKPVSGVQTAYDIMQENGFNPLWVDPSECLKVKERERNCVYIMELFEGEAFEHLTSVGCRIFGPQCVLSCLHLKLGIPKTRMPIYSLAMKDLVISCTSLDKPTREDVMCKVQWMGGVVSKDFTDSVTHLVAGEVGSKKYIVAGGLGKHIMTPEWVEQVWLQGKDRHLHGTDEQFQKFKCPIFKNMVITVSGLDPEKRKQVKSLVEAEGGSYSGEMKVNQCTHLIIKEPKGQKYEFARKWKIQIVSLRWLQESVEKGYSLDEEKFRVESPATQRPQVQTSTPDRERRSTAQRLSIMGDISSISHLPDLTHLNETTQANTTRQAADDGDSILDLNLTALNPDLFLDGCRIYLSGFRGPHMEKLKKIINLGGATRFNQINDNVSHVIMGEKIEADLKTLKQATFRPHVVTAAWLVDSLKQGKLKDERQYSCVELPPLDASPPKAKIIKRPSLEKTEAPDPSQNNNTEAEDQEMADLMSQYMRQHNQESDQAVKPDDETIQAEPAETTTDLTQQPDEQGEQAGVFGGKKFVCFGFEDDNQAELTGYIEEYGGKVVSVPTRQVCDYAIVPIGGFPVPVTVTEVVTNAWLQMCLEQETLLPVDGNELFRPVEIVEESSPLEGCVLSISGFTGTERDCLMHISEVLGARCQEYFVRKANKGLLASTHLITKDAGGSKYKAAMNWSLPAVSKRWLFACARSGRREREENYLIDNDKAETSNPQTSEQACNKGQNSVNNKTDVSHNRTESEAAKNSRSDQNESEDNVPNGMDAPQKQLNRGSCVNAETERSAEKVDCASASSDKLQSDASTEVTRKKSMSEHEAQSEDSETEEEAEHPSPPTQVSPPGGCSQKENIGHAHVTPSLNRPQHGRLQELLGQLGPELSKGLDSPASRGIDTPGKFMNPNKLYNPKFDVSAMLAAVQSPVTNTPSSKKTGRRRKSSLPLDDALMFHLSQGIKNSMRRGDDIVPGADRSGDGGDHRDSVFPAMEENLGPLREVVIAVSKKLSSHQAEYNNIAASLGADYRWTYDKSCTHFIFQGRPNDTNKEFRTARDQGKIIVSPHWLTMCEEQKARVDESLFPHNYNPNLSLSVVTSKRDTPARATRKSSRSLKSQSEDLSERPSKVQATGAEVAEGRTRRRETSKSETVQDKPLPSEPLPAELAEKRDENMDLNQIPAMESGGTLEMREAFNKEIESILATTKTKKSARRKSRRLNSSGQLEGETPSSAESVNKSRQSARVKQPDPPGKQWEHVHSEPSQSVQVTWDDETARLEQERLALELQRAHSPTQCTQSAEELGDNAQYSETDDSMEVQINLKPGPETNTRKSGEFRTPTPEPPTLGFPTAAANQTEAEPIELIREEMEEKADVPPPVPPVFIVSGMQQQERDDYGALVEQLGGRMLEGQHYHASCTHLVVANPTRNEKFMACVASGKWVLHKSYFEACRQEGRFVEEEVHEWGSDGTRSILASCSALTTRLAVAAHRWRIRVQDNLKASKTCRGAFEGWNVVLCTDRNKEENFKRLLEAGGAQVVATRPPFSSAIEATHAFLDLHKITLSQEDLERLLQSGVKCLKPEYIAAFLTTDPSPNPDEFCPTDVMALRASMSVPEQGVRKRKSSSVSDGGKRTRRL